MKRAELKPGGLAVIVVSSIGINLGRVVETVMPLGNPEALVVAGVEYINEHRVTAWHVKAVNNSPLVDADGDTHIEMAFAEGGLMPIGDADPELKRVQEKEKEHVLQ